MAWYGAVVPDSGVSRALVPDPLDDALTPQASGVWALLSKFAPVAIRPLACLSHPFWDMANCVADAFLSIAVRLEGFPLDPSPLALLDDPSDQISEATSSEVSFAAAFGSSE